MILGQRKKYRQKLFRVASVLSSVSLLFITWLNISFAQSSAAAEAASFVETFNRVILFPTISLLSAIAFFVFLWGCFEYFMNATNDQARQKGVNHITYGIIGLVVMLSAYSILSIAAATLGLNDELDCASDSDGCSSAFTL